jgi:hypothetical protein
MTQTPSLLAGTAPVIRQSRYAVDSAALLRDALLAAAIGRVLRTSDPRDLMVGLAADYFVAQQLGLVPAELFDNVASCPMEGCLTCSANSVYGQISRSTPSDGCWSRQQRGRTSPRPRPPGHAGPPVTQR